MTVIAVLGAGNIGATLARKWAAAGHEVRLGSRDPGADAIQALAASLGARTLAHAEAVDGAGVVVLALPGAAVAPVVAGLGGALDGKIVIDTTNKVGAAVMNSIADL